MSNAITLDVQKYSKKIDGIILVIVHSEGYLTTVKYQKRSDEFFQSQQVIDSHCLM